MKFSLVFENSGDSIPFVVVENLDLFNFFVKKVNSESKNLFGNNYQLSKDIDKKLNDVNWALSKTNEVLHLLIGQSFEQKDKLTDYLDQDFLNKVHCDWVFSQQRLVDIDAMRVSNQSDIARIGKKLHEIYPDEIRIIKVGEAMDKLGYFYPYEEVNLSIHSLESCFSKKSNLEFSGKSKWEVFDNPFIDTVVSNSNVVNFSFGYIYQGRNFYQKFVHFDTELKYNDHYSYEKLEYSFHLSLDKPQTIPFSKEFLTWCQEHNVKPVTMQLPFANIIDLEKNLFEYRKILYKNSKQNNQASIITH